MKRYNNARARAQAKNISFTQFRERIIKTFKHHKELFLEVLYREWPSVKKACLRDCC